MAAAAREEAHRPLLKLKLTGAGDLERVRAVRAGAPDDTLIVDANEAWTLDHLRDYGPSLAELGVALIEQPLPAGQEAAPAPLPPPGPPVADRPRHPPADPPAPA